MTWDSIAARQLGEAWCESWNGHDFEAIMAHYTDDVRFSSPAVRTRWGIASGWLVSAERLRAHIERSLAAPGLQYTFVDTLVGIDVMTVLYRRETWMLLAEVMELEEAGRARVLRVVLGHAQASPGATSQHSIREAP